MDRNRVDKVEESGRAERSMSEGQKISGRLMQFLTAALAVVLCAALAFYVSDGYYQIGNDKFRAYRNVMSAGCILLFIALIPCSIFRFRAHESPRISATDGFVSLYLIFLLISVLSGGYYRDALWGYPGWNMGLFSQVGFVLLYFFLSRFGRYYRVILAALCVMAGIVYVLGILNRLMIDPLGFYKGLTNVQKTLFLSTLGQASWYGSFLAVTLPVGMSAFLYAERKAVRALSGLLMLSGFCTLVTQNSDSAYFALAGVMIVFFLISSRDPELMRRFMTALALLFASGKVMYYLMQIRPNPEFKPDFVTELMWTSNVTGLLLIVCLLGAAALYLMQKHIAALRYPDGLMRRLRRAVPAAAVITAAVMVCVIILQTKGMIGGRIGDKLAAVPYFHWDPNWGSGRGRIWSFWVKMFAEADLKYKLFGVGPDCFQCYSADHYSVEQTAYWGRMKLTNAHNEWMTSLVNVGILGTAAYAGIYVAKIRSLMRMDRLDAVAAGIAASCVSYMLYNFFCYQQVLCTPFVFMLMGIGEYIVREDRGIDSVQGG